MSRLTLALLVLLAGTLAAIAQSNGPATGTINVNGQTYSFSASYSTYSSSSTSSSAWAPPASAKRPSYNTGNGFFVLGGGLYDANGNIFRIRGVNHLHWDNGSPTGIAKSGANTQRWVIDFTRPVASNVALIQSGSIALKNVPIVGNWTATCSTDPATLTAAVNTWVAQASGWTTLNPYLIPNILNEWGPSNSPVWASSYETAIASMRKAGYLGPLLIDSGGCGQDIYDLLNYAAAVFTSDPQKNVMFALHVYGNAATSLMSTPTWYQQLAKLSETAGMVFIIGEFGPGNNVGPSPTYVSPMQVITAAEQSGLGWLAWAWDDNNLVNCASNDLWFSMTYQCGNYTMPSDLTLYGQTVVFNPVYGLSVIAKPASVF